MRVNDCGHCVHGDPALVNFCRDGIAKGCGPYKALFKPRDESTEQNDDINHPSHYTDGPVCPHCGKPIECITITERMSFTIGNAVKYLWRAGKKKENTYVKDLKKAAWYVNREIERESK